DGARPAPGAAARRGAGSGRARGGLGPADRRPRPARPGRTRDRRAQPRAVAEADARGAPACARELPAGEESVPAGAANGPRPVQALPADDTGRARPRRPGPPALERAAGVTQAGAPAGLRAVPAAATRTPAADPGAPPPLRGHDAGTARAREPEFRALAVVDAGAAARAPRAVAADSARGAPATPPAAASAAPATGAMRARILAAVVLLVRLAAGSSAHAAEDDARILHALNRVTYGPRPGDVERVRAMGLAAYLEQQLAPSGIDDHATEAALASLGTLRMSIPELLRAYPRPDPRVREKVQTGEMSRRDAMEMYPPEKRPARIVAEVQTAKAVRSVMSERQLQEVMTDFWFNHFNVYASKGEGRWYVSPYERDVIRPLALGRFPDLLRATAPPPAMLFYLDNWLSARPDFVVMNGPQRGRRAGLNENYGRELMELHTLGVDGGYTQQDVREVARAFTG